eukprot:Skav216049  [mRNA]  locus=scaffold2930:334975:344993:+ [translate_table: standard]
MGSSWSSGACWQRDERCRDAGMWEEIAREEVERLAKTRGLTAQRAVEDAQLSVRSKEVCDVSVQTDTADEEHSLSHSMCSICWEPVATLVAVPCGHQCLCDRCSLRVDQCPICRNKVALYVQAFVSHPPAFQEEYLQTKSKLDATLAKNSHMKKALRYWSATMAPPPKAPKHSSNFKDRSLLFPQTPRVNISDASAGASGPGASAAPQGVVRSEG